MFSFFIQNFPYTNSHDYLVICEEYNLNGNMVQDIVFSIKQNFIG